MCKFQRGAIHSKYGRTLFPLLLVMTCERIISFAALACLDQLPIPWLGEMFHIFRKVTFIPFVHWMKSSYPQGFSAHDVELVRKYGRIVGWVDKAWWQLSDIYENFSSSVYEGTVPMIQLTDLDLLRKVLIKDSQLFINRRVCLGEESPFPFQWLPTLDYQRRRRAIRTHSLTSPRRCLEECSKYRLTDVFDGKTESGKCTTFVRKQSHLLLPDVGSNEHSEWCLQPTSIGVRRQTGDLRLQTVRCSAET